MGPPDKVRPCGRATSFGPDWVISESLYEGRECVLGHLSELTMALYAVADFLRFSLPGLDQLWS